MTVSFSPYTASRDRRIDHPVRQRGDCVRNNGPATLRSSSNLIGKGRAQLKVERQRKRRMLRPSHDSNRGVASMICSKCWCWQAMPVSQRRKMRPRSHQKGIESFPQGAAKLWVDGIGAGVDWKVFPPG